MAKLTLTRERLEQLADNNTICKVSWDERIELAQIALAAIDNEPYCVTLGTRTPKNPAAKSDFLLYAEKLAADTKALAERVKRNDITAVTTSEEHRQLRDLVMMVKMLCRTVRKYNPESQQAADYTAYLQKEGLISAADCLRGSDPKETDTEDRRG